MVPGGKLAVEVGNERLANMVTLEAVVRKTAVIALESLRNAPYSALDLRYHKMISINIKALERGARSVREMQWQILHERRTESIRRFPY